MEEKKSFAVFKDYLEYMEGMTDQDIGAAMRAVWMAENGQEPPELSGVAWMFFTVIRRDLERANTGHWSTVANTGDRSASVNTGDQSTAANTGCWGVATVSGEESVACALGYEGKAKGAKGCWIVLAEWKDSHRKDVRCFYVDGESVKANVLYTLEDGELVEAD